MIKFFSAAWCTPCNNLKNSLTEDDLEGVELIDVDNQPEETLKYDIRSVPTIVKLDAEGKEIDRKLGTMSRLQFLDWIHG